MSFSHFISSLLFLSTDLENNIEVGICRVPMKYEKSTFSDDETDNNVIFFSPTTKSGMSLCPSFSSPIDFSSTYLYEQEERLERTRNED